MGVADDGLDLGRQSTNFLVFICTMTLSLSISPSALLQRMPGLLLSLPLSQMSIEAAAEDEETAIVYE